MRFIYFPAFQTMLALRKNVRLSIDIGEISLKKTITKITSMHF